MCYKVFVMTDVKEIFGERLRGLRKEEELSQEEISKKAGLDRTYVGKIERGEKSPSLETIEKLAISLNTEMKELFDFKNCKEE